MWLSCRCLTVIGESCQVSNMFYLFISTRVSYTQMLWHLSVGDVSIQCRCVGEYLSVSNSVCWCWNESYPFETYVPRKCNSYWPCSLSFNVHVRVHRFHRSFIFRKTQSILCWIYPIRFPLHGSGRSPPKCPCFEIAIDSLIKSLRISGPMVAQQNCTNMYIIIYIYIYLYTYYCFTLYHIILYHFTLHYIILHYITLHYITLYYIKLYYIIFYYIISYYNIILIWYSIIL